MNLNERTQRLLSGRLTSQPALHSPIANPSGGTWYDFGVSSADPSHGIAAGLLLAQVCLADLADVRIQAAALGDLAWPHVAVHTDAPVAACLGSQYAGWQLAVDDFFGMGSGPMRAAAGIESTIEELNLKEAATGVIGVLETSQKPGAKVFDRIAEKCSVPVENVTLLAARTASMAGSLQIAARCLETALHKLHELKFDVTRIHSGFGIAPLSPVAKNDLEGIGRTNDSILYAGDVCLMVSGDDDSIAETGPRVPSGSSEHFGQPFLEIFEAAGRDFYKIDPHLFSPARVVFQNIESGRVHVFGGTQPDIVRQSFGL